MCVPKIKTIEGGCGKISTLKGDHIMQNFHGNFVHSGIIKRGMNHECTKQHFLTSKGHL